MCSSDLSNCDRDMQVALRDAMGAEPVMIWHGDSEMPNVDLITIPGGFSFGDYLRAGCMAAKSPIMQEVVDRAAKGVPVLGVCNGFQVLTESGLLPGALMRNAALKYVCREVNLKVATNDTVFTGQYMPGQLIRIPIAHHDGNYFADEKTLKNLEDTDRVAFHYCDETGAVTDAANPNGSQLGIAGIFNEHKTVLGMMPHPERLADPELGGSDGRPMFEGLVQALS